MIGESSEGCCEGMVDGQFWAKVGVVGHSEEEVEVGHLVKVVEVGHFVEEVEEVVEGWQEVEEFGSG